MEKIEEDYNRLQSGFLKILRPIIVFQSLSLFCFTLYIILGGRICLLASCDFAIYK